MTLKQAKALTYRQVLHHTFYQNADGTPQRWRVNGMVKEWKRDKGRVCVPLKYGLFGFGYLTESNLEEFTLKGVGQ